MNKREQVCAALARRRSEVRWLPYRGSCCPSQHSERQRGMHGGPTAPLRLRASLALPILYHTTIKGLRGTPAPRSALPQGPSTWSHAGVRHDPVASAIEAGCQASATIGTRTSQPRVTDRGAVAILWRCCAQQTPQTPNACRMDGRAHPEVRRDWLGCVGGAIGLIT